MKVRWRDSLYLGLLCGSLLAQSSSSPAGALEELVTTQDPQVILRHLPQSIQERLEALPAMERGQYLQGLLNKVTENGKMGLRAAGNTWELVDRESNVLATVRLKNVFVTGADALLHLEAEKENWSEGALVSMRLEGKEWRFTGVAPLKSTDLGIESELHRYFSSDRNEDAAMSALGAIYRQVMSAFGNHPDGYPSSLAIALQSQRIKQAAARATQPEEVSWMEHDPMVHQGYIFRYVVIDPGFAARKAFLYARANGMPPPPPWNIVRLGRAASLSTRRRSSARPLNIVRPTVATRLSGGDYTSR